MTFAKSRDENEGSSRITSARVTHISLTEEPANRRRIRIIKSREAPKMKFKKMLGLTPEPRVTLTYGETAEEAERLAKSLGVSGQANQVDGVFMVGEKPATEGVAIVSSETSGYVVEHVSKRLSTFDPDALTFGEIVNQEGFFPSLGLAMDALGTTIMNAAQSDDISTKEGFSEVVTAAISEFGQFASDLISELPEKAFKHEGTSILSGSRVEKTAPEAPGELPTDPPADPSTGDPSEAGEKEGADSEDSAEMTQVSTEHAAATSASEGDVSHEYLSKMVRDAVTASLGPALESAVEGAVQKHVEPLRETVQRVQEGLTETEKKTADVERTVKGYVPGDDSTSGEKEGFKSARAAHRDSDPPLLDTGFSRARH